MFSRLLQFSLPVCAVIAVCASVRVTGQENEGPPELPLESPLRANSPNGGTEQRLVALGEALAAANAELEALRDQHAQLKLQMEALGIAAVKGDQRSLQNRLLAATSELKTSEKVRAELVERNSRLAEAAAAFMARPGEPALKASLEAALKSASSGVESAAPEAVPLESARVVSCKSELGLAVINAGRESGVRTGAPLRIVRADKTVASGLVIDVRDRIAGIFITGSDPAAVRVGDAVKPELIQTTPQK